MTDHRRKSFPESVCQAPGMVPDQLACYNVLMTSRKVFVIFWTVLAGIAMLSPGIGTAGGGRPAGGPSGAGADYILIPLVRLTGMADLVVVGRVDAVEEDTFQFSVDEFLVNHHASRTLTVEKNIPPEMVGQRQLPYGSGQRFALFLKKDRDADVSTWKILGLAGEGEMPVEDDNVYFGAYDLPGLPYESHDVHGVTRNLQHYDLDTFRDAVKGYPACFSWRLGTYIQNNKERSRWVPSKICADESVSDYRSKSWLHEYLARETIRQLPVTGE